MDPVKTVRIFLSSPGDVAAERESVRDLLLGLARGAFVRDRLHIDVVSWDDPHGGATMDARFTPQQAVDRSLPTPAECDLTVVLLRGRMGTPLTETRADGSPYLSGTEWEFENALAANKPVLLYRLTEEVPLDPNDQELDEKLRQKQRVDAFFEQFRGEGGTIQRAYALSASIDDLLNRLRLDVDRHLHELLREADARRAPWLARIARSRLFRALATVVLCMLPVATYFFRKSMCSTWPWRMPRAVLSACVRPLSYRETILPTAPSGGLCSESRLRDVARHLERVEWHQIELVSHDSTKSGAYAVVFRVWVSRDERWSLLASHPAASGGTTVARLRDVPADGAGWQVRMLPGSRFTVTLCAEPERTAGGSSFGKSLRRHIVVKE
jgi:hypothetical protein